MHVQDARRTKKLTLSSDICTIVHIPHVSLTTCSRLRHRRDPFLSIQGPPASSDLQPANRLLARCDAGIGADFILVLDRADRDLAVPPFRAQPAESSLETFWPTRRLSYLTLLLLRRRRHVSPPLELTLSRAARALPPHHTHNEHRRRPTRLGRQRPRPEAER